MAEQQQEQTVEVGPEEQLEEAIEAVRQLRSLVRLPGWDRLANVMRGQANNRQNTILGALVPYPEYPVSLDEPVYPVDGLSRIFHQEFEKGVRSGLLMAVDLPRFWIEHYEAQIVQLREDLGMYDEEEENDG